VTASIPESVGLGGDGDEIAAIRDVEGEFGIRLDYADASGWHTAGDVFASLSKALPVSERRHSDLWPRFAKALSQETGIDPARITPESPLLTKTRVSYWLVGLVIGVLFAVASLTAWVSA
jgi:hypothetical protein